MIYSAFHIAACVKAACKGAFLVQQQSKEQVQALVSDHCPHYFGFMVHFRVSNYNFHCFSLNQATLLCEVFLHIGGMVL